MILASSSLALISATSASFGLISSGSTLGLTSSSMGFERPPVPKEGFLSDHDRRLAAAAAADGV